MHCNTLYTNTTMQIPLCDWRHCLDMKFSLKKEHAIIFKCYHTQHWFHKGSCEKLTTL